jgi:alkylhydroperoxidase/carboxymuconolactone decarboxylase family protein YurZ
MDERTEILISLASASASNCIPCFDHYYQEAMVQNLDIEDIRKALEISSKVKGGAALFTKRAIDEAMGEGSADSDLPCCEENLESSTPSCC